MEGPFDFYNAGLGKPYFYNKGTGEPFIPKVLFPAPTSWPQLSEHFSKHLPPAHHARYMGVRFRAHQAATPIFLTAGSFN